MPNPKPITIGLKNAVGDTVVLTGAVRDLMLQYPGQYRVSMATHAGSVWVNNPHVVPDNVGGRRIDLVYGDEMRRANKGQRFHFLAAFHNLLGLALGVPLVPQLPRPDLHVGADETHPPVPQPYWVIFPGWKPDIPLKAWPAEAWQRLIDMLAGWDIHCVQVGGKQGHNPVLAGCTSLVGQTTIRELFALIRDAEGVICGITQGMHIAAALEKPCVVLGGGREAWWWEAYTNSNEGFGPVATGKLRVPHRFLHTIGMLDCCETRGCAKVALQASSRHKPRQVCTNSAIQYGQLTPRCLAEISPATVRDAVLSYYLDGTLPGHGPELKQLAAAMPELPPINQPLEILRQDGARLQIQTLDSPDRDPPAPEPTGPLPERPGLASDPQLDNPLFGSRITICVLTYGDYLEMHQRCIGSILRSVPAERLELRVAGNALGRESREYLEKLHDCGDIAVLDLSDENRGKYPVMRGLFRQPPLSTRWTVWFDDDTMCDVRPDWLNLLAAAIVKHYPDGYRAFGPLYRYGLSESWLSWCAAGNWYRNKPWPMRQGHRRFVPFPTGSFWAVESQDILDLDIPDLRLGHNKGDVTIGCQLWQHDRKIWSFSQTKEIVNWSSVERRGVTTQHPAEA